MTFSVSKKIRALIGPHHVSYPSSSRGKQFSSVTCTVVHDRRWSWEQPTCISEIMLKLCENVTASHLAWKQPWIISLSNDLFSHQTQCLLSPGCFIATIRDRWGKHKQFSWIERLNRSSSFLTGSLLAHWNHIQRSGIVLTHQFDQLEE